MEIIFYHAAHRNRNPQLIQHLEGNIHLSSSSVHHDQVREPAEASHLIGHALFIKLLSLF